ncbi:DUF4328 domain-containing protein [Brevibacillus invocatus]|uniref:DUF4328 domain-containing protein n=1 Tax=Brevibacillus invocatus TaxID=173959 RepID=UPI00203EC46B|nr:DUF4328 domain-containing protein [Brevibacillus invocatus]MCM3078618.1 hypothetical protein [Brevibacillus invocatus]MCM3429133.1 hypothetical protein [Brevibacillus invocatus]
MQEKVDAWGKYLFVFLIVGLASSGVSLLFSLVEAWNEPFYMEFVIDLDIAVGIFTSIAAIIATILFLGWIYRVHKEYKEISSDYPVTPGGALCRILIPFYNIVGLWTIYSNMSRFLIQYDTSVKKHGKRLRAFIPYYYFSHMIYSFLNRRLLMEEEYSINLLLLTVGMEVIVSLSYIAMFVAITSGLKAVREHQQQLQLEQEAATAAEEAGAASGEESEAGV